MRTMYVKYSMLEKYSYDLNRLLGEIKGRLMRDFADYVDFDKVYSFELRYDQEYVIDDQHTRLKASKEEFYRMIEITKRANTYHKYNFEIEITVSITYEEKEVKTLDTHRRSV